MADGGWIKVYRKIRQSFVWTDANQLKLWLLILMKANHAPSKFLFNGQEVSVTSGELVTGAHALAFEMNDGVRRDNQVSWRQVWRWVKRFENNGMLTIKSNTKYSVISISKWCDYQDNDNQVSIKRQSSVNQVSTNKKEEKEKKEKKSTLHRPADAEPIVNYANVIAYLNKKSGKHFKDTETNRKLIRSRLNEGFSKDDIKTAIDHVVAGWKGTEMERYIQPSTIFRASKFEGYVNAVPRVFAGKSKGYGKPQRQEATPEWMQEGYQTPKQEVSADAKAELAEQLKELEQLRSRNATSS